MSAVSRHERRWTAEIRVAPEGGTAPAGSVVVGVDRTSSSAALAWGAREATRRRLPLHLVHGDDVQPAARSAGPPPSVGDTSEASSSDALVAAVNAVQSLAPGLAITAERCLRPAAEALVEASSTAGMVVLAARGRGPLAAALLGSVSLHVAGNARSPVVVVKDVEDPDRPRDSVVVGVDGSEDSQACLAYGFEQASSRGTSLDVVHAWSSRMTAAYRMEQQGHLLLAEALAGWVPRYRSVEVRRSVVHDEPVSALIRHADGAHLLVVGSRGRGAVSSLVLGSVSQGVLQRAGGPVAVVRARQHTVSGDASVASPR